MSKPELLSDGTCRACLGGWLCEYHKREGLEHDKVKSREIRLAVRSLKQAAIDRECASIEWEADEFNSQPPSLTILESKDT